MTLQEIRDLFDNIINESAWWRKFKGSEFVNYLTTFVAQVYLRAQNVAARRLQESFLSLAQRMSSILAHAESRGYVPQKRIPTKILVMLTNNGDSPVSITANTPLFSSDLNLNYLLENAVSIPSGEAIQIEVIQAEIKIFETVVSIEKKYLTLQLSADTSEELASVSVEVKPDNGVYEYWGATYLFRNTDETSKAYVETYSGSQQTGVRFGNGLSGLVPKIGDSVRLTCITTEGESTIGAGLGLTFVDGSLGDVSAVVQETLQSGSARENIETLRNNALYYTAYDNSVVVDSDYDYFVRRNISGLTYYRVWGEKEQEKLVGYSDLAHSGQVYMCAYHPDIAQPEIKTSLSNLFKTITKLNTNFNMVNCKTSLFTLTVDGVINSSLKVNQSISTIRAALAAELSEVNISHNGFVSLSQIWDIVQSCGVYSNFTVVVDDGVDIDVSLPIDTFRFLDVDNSTVTAKY